jgi:uncharacterized protein (TIGR02757 family)
LHRFSDPRDIELAGFIASQFAYGRVEQIMAFLGRLFGLMERGPYSFIASGDFVSLRGLYYRFQKGPDLIRLFGILSRIVETHGGVGKAIEHYFEGDLRKALWAAREDLVGGNNDLLFFFPRAAPASPFKRWNLYARWMVRKDDIDFGLWKFLAPRDLIVPLDANIFKIGRCQGWTRQKAQSWRAACDITDVLKRFCPEDPLKYDFFLCHLVGIGGGCTGVKGAGCAERCFSDEI